MMCLYPFNHYKYTPIFRTYHPSSMRPSNFHHHESLTAEARSLMNCAPSPGNLLARLPTRSLFLLSAILKGVVFVDLEESYLPPKKISQKLSNYNLTTSKARKDKRKRNERLKDNTRKKKEGRGDSRPIPPPLKPDSEPESDVSPPDSYPPVAPASEGAFLLGVNSPELTSLSGVPSDLGSPLSVGRVLDVYWIWGVWGRKNRGGKL